MTEGSLFAGIMGFGEGFRRAGFQNKWAVEIEPFCQAVIRTRFPETKVFKDVNDCGKHNLEPVDVITAGFPCQDLSVAGKRAGLEGSRSGLFWQVVRIMGELKPPWVVIENVPGLFSSNEGRDFAVVLNALDELGYGLAWRVLDSQHFGVAQRRRRVFVVGRFGEPCPREVLFESAGGAGDFAESGETGADVAGTLAAGAHPSGFNGRDAERGNIVVGPFFSQHDATGGWMPNAEQAADGYLQVAAALRESDGHHGRSSPRGDGCDNLVADGVSGSADRMPGVRECGDAAIERAGARSGRHANPRRNVCSPADSNRVRDFAGLPQGLDSARYRALGNAVTVSVAQWIGERILKAAAETTWGPFALNQGMESN